MQATGIYQAIWVANVAMEYYGRAAGSDVLGQLLHGLRFLVKISKKGSSRSPVTTSPQPRVFEGAGMF